MAERPQHAPLGGVEGGDREPAAARLAKWRRALGRSKDPELYDLRDGLEALVDGRAATLDQALNLVPQPGRRRPATVARLAQRDRLLCEAAARWWSGRPVADQARNLGAAIALYESTAWPRERGLNACPPRRAPTVQGVAWHVLKLGDGRAPGEHRIRAILIASSGFSRSAARAT